MSLQGDLEFRDANKITFIGGSSNTLIDLTTGSLGVGVTGTSLSSNLHVAGNKIKVGDNIFSTDGPHGRGVALLKKYPEIAFADGKFDSNDSTNTYVQAGYTVSASATNSDTTTKAWKAFNDTQFEGNGGWCTPSVYSTSSDGSATSSATEFPSGRRGEYIDLKLPKAIKVDYFIIKSRQGVGTATYIPEDAPGEGYLYGSDNGSIWVQIKEFTGLTYGGGAGMGQEMVQVGSTTFYKYLRLQGTKRSGQNSTDAFLAIGELEYYGYEEDPPLGDTSIDTTLKSIMNTPQTTGANVYTDAKLSSAFTNRVTGPTPVGTATTHDNTNKYWEMNGELTSNITVEANTFLEGDQPHAVSVWFNSSNLEANVSNTCVFSISDQEKLDSVNLDLQSNTWHNLTYSYQGEGGSRVAYLDGRKVAEDQAEDTFGEYPPFAMTGYSQGGYVVSASNEDLSPNYLAWYAFDALGTNNNSWTPGNKYTTGGSPATYPGPARLPGVDTSGTIIPTGEWLKLQLPYELVLSYLRFNSRSTAQSPKDFKIYGSNDDYNWHLLLTGVGTGANPNANLSDTVRGDEFAVNATKGYKYLAISVQTAVSQSYMHINDLRYYGHRENDLVRLPDPTNVLKYPHIAMTGPAQRGYAVSASSTYTADNQAWKMFADDAASNPSPYGGYGWWISAQSKYRQSGDNDYLGGTADNLGTYTGSSTATDNGVWVQLKMPHKILLSSVFLGNGAWHETAPGSFKFYGTNNDQDWTLIKTFTGQNPQDGSSFAINATVAYRTIGLVITHTAGTNSYGSTGISEMELYGTGVDSIPIQIGGGNIDKVANFRVYDKFVGEDQALEIWDAQKDEFGRAKSSMTLHKGRLGLGTTEPEGRLAVLDEPHNLEEFPPGAMSGGNNFGGGGGETYFNGYGKFRATAANSLSGTTYGAIKAFNKANLVNADRWRSNNDFTNGIANTSYVLADGVTPGVWIKLEMPINIKLARYEFVGQEGQGPADAEIWASNDDKNWTKIHSFSGNTIGDNTTAVSYPVNSENFYKIYAMVVLKTISLTVDATSIKELKFFGTREQGQSVLHDGQLTLTKNLTVPSIGPSVTDTRHAVPKRHNLVVEFDTSTNPTDLTTVRDTSGMGNDIIMHGNARYDAIEKAFRLDGTSGTYMSGTQNLGTGTPAHTITGWFKQSVSLNNWTYVMFVGTSTTGQMSGMLISNTGQIVFDIYNTRIDTTVDAGTDIWHHFAGVFKGGTSTWDNASTDLYINGQLEASAAPDSGTQYPFNLTGNGIQFGSSTNFVRYFNGSISQFKLYNTVLTAGDVKTLYDMGRGDSYHVTNFQNTLVGINLGNGRAPRSALDVRDQIYARTNVIGTFTGQHICFPDESMEKGLIVSAKKNQFVKLNGLAIGKSAITIDESLPIVSLSNVVQDKACFGVVSKMEETNTEYRTEITGGLVSESIKTLGDNRAIVNSVGEGAIWVVDTNGSLESGDYITTSNVAGYGQRQESEFLANYTVAKITMDCDFTASNVAVQTIKREQTGTRTITEDAWNQLVEYDRYSNVEDEITTYYQIQRGENVLDENGQLQFEDKTGATESPYERRFLTTDGTQTDEANAVHIAAFVGCTYHCG